MHALTPSSVRPAGSRPSATTAGRSSGRSRRPASCGGRDGSKTLPVGPTASTGPVAAAWAVSFAAARNCCSASSCLSSISFSCSSVASAGASAVPLRARAAATASSGCRGSSRGMLPSEKKRDWARPLKSLGWRTSTGRAEAWKKSRSRQSPGKGLLGVVLSGCLFCQSLPSLALVQPTSSSSKTMAKRVPDVRLSLMALWKVSK
mmetsp:Transcript_13538/g.29739  ORF Transcript_13538/g.29739 Transcript_13538/m.29739 type:complete len:205 (+) Transcript_13538:102-716(+)